MNTFAS